MKTSMTSRGGIEYPGPMLPVRIAEGGGTDYERELLAAAQREMPPAESAQRVAAALRAASVRSPASAASGDGAAASAVPSVLRPLMAGIAGAGIAAIVASQWPQSGAGIGAGARADAAPARAALAPPAASRQPPPASARNREPAPELREPPRAEAAPPKRRQAQTQPQPPPSRPPAPSERVERAAGLAEEVRAIETIQSLLAAGRARAASSALASYRRRFPKGELSIEADLLEVDVELAGGDRGKAQALARALLERSEAKRYRERLHDLVESDAHTDLGGSKPKAR